MGSCIPSHHLWWLNAPLVLYNYHSLPLMSPLRINTLPHISTHSPLHLFTLITTTHPSSLHPFTPTLLTGGVRDTAPGEDKQDVINEAGKQEIPLTLTNKFEGLADDSSNMKALFVRYTVSVCLYMCARMLKT